MLRSRAPLARLMTIVPLLVLVLPHLIAEIHSEEADFRHISLKGESINPSATSSRQLQSTSTVIHRVEEEEEDALDKNG